MIAPQQEIYASLIVDLARRFVRTVNPLRSRVDLVVVGSSVEKKFDERGGEIEIQPLFRCKISYETGRWSWSC